MSRSKVTSMLNHDVAYLHPQPMSILSINTLWYPRCSLDKSLKIKVTTLRSNQAHTITMHSYTHKPMPHTTAKFSQGPILILYIYTPNQCPHQISTYGFQDTAWTRFFLLFICHVTHLPNLTPWVKTYPHSLYRLCDKNHMTVSHKEGQPCLSIMAVLNCLFFFLLSRSISS